MSGLLSPVPVLKFFDNNGNPLAFGKVFTYQAGTVTPAPTYTDASLGTPNSNPILLNFRGECEIWIPTNTAYKFDIQDSNGFSLPGSPIDQIQDVIYTPTQAAIALLLNPQTPAEIAAGVMPTNFLYTELDPRRYGVDTAGATDATSTVAAWISVGEQYASVLLKMTQAGRVRMDGGFTVDTNKVGIDWSGSTIDFTHLTVSHALQFTQSTSDVNQRVLLNSAHPISNARFLGPGVGVNADGAFLNDAVNNNLAGVKFKNIGFQDFATDITLALGAFCCTFEDCTFTVVSSGTDAVHSIAITAGNNGEKNTFINCFWFNRQFHVNALSGNSDTYFHMCSFDTFTESLNVAAGIVHLTECHMENATDSGVYGKAASGASLFVKDTTLITQVARASFDFFTSNNAGAGGGVFIEDCNLECGSLAVTSRLVGGTGTARVRNIVQGTSSARPVLGGSFMNILAYGDMESTAWAGDWTLGGSVPPTRSTAVSHGGAASMLIPGSLASAPTPSSARATRGCAPGQYLQGEFYYNITALTGTGASFNYTVLYADASGTQIGSSGNSISVTANSAGWVHAVIAAVNPAPAGTVSAAFAMSVTGTASGAPQVFCDDFCINIT